MQITPTAHLDGDGTGDPLRHCEQLVLSGQRGSDVRLLAAMARVLNTPEGRDRFRDLVEQLDAQIEAELAAGGAHEVADGFDFEDRAAHDCDAEPTADACPHCGAARELAGAGY